jgi:hypothetical protein
VPYIVRICVAALALCMSLPAIAGGFLPAIHNGPKVAAREYVVPDCAFGHHNNSVRLEQVAPSNFSLCVIRSAPLIWDWNDGSQHYSQVGSWPFLFDTAGSGNTTRLGFLDSALTILKNAGYKGIFLAGSTPPLWAVIGNSREVSVTAMATGGGGTLTVTAPGNGFWTNSQIYFHGGTLPTTSPQIVADTAYCAQGNNTTVAGNTLDIKTCGGTSITVTSGSPSGVKIGLVNSNPADWNDLKNYLSAVITRAKTAGIPVVAVEGVNEWHNCGTIFYCGSAADVLTYNKKLFQFTKEIDPSIKVLMAPSNSLNNTFYQEMLNASTDKNFGFEAIATHGYTYPNDDSYNSNTHIAQTLDDFIAGARSRGAGGLPAYNTELGSERDPGTFTVTVDTSADTVTWNAHGKAAGTPVVLTTTGALPTGITSGTPYYVSNPTTNTIKLAATPGGTTIDFSGSQSGTHTIQTHTQTYNARQVSQHMLLTMARAKYHEWAALLGYAWGSFNLMGHYGMCEGNCSIGSGVPNNYGIAWGVVQTWLRGAKNFIYSPASTNLTEIEFSMKDGRRARAVWNADQSIGTYTVPAWAKNWQDVLGNSGVISGGTVTISFTPILIMQ